MHGHITVRIRKNAYDKQGKFRKKLKVYDVKFRYKNPATGKIKESCKRGFLKKADAEGYLLDISNKFASNSFLPHTNLTVRQYLTEWLEVHRSNLRTSTYNGYKAIVDRHLCPNLGNILLEDLTAPAIEKMYAFLLKEGRVDHKGGLSKTSILYTHRVLSKALNHAIKHRILAVNPIKGVDAPKPNRYHGEVYSAEEIMELLRIVKDDPYFEIPVALAAVCGLRRGEILALTYEDIDFEAKIIHINKQLTEQNHKLVLSAPKSEASNRTISAPIELFNILDRQMAQRCYKPLVTEAVNTFRHLLICRDDGTPVHPTSFTKKFAKLLKKNGLKKIRFHDLRHPAITMMVNTGIPMKTVSSIAGHANMSTTANIYAHTLTTDKKKAAIQVGQILFSRSS